MPRISSLLLLAAASVTASSFALASGAAASSIRSAKNSAVFEDATGESAGAADIETVVVSNDDGGLLTFRVDIPTHPTLTEDMRIRIWLDSDDDLTTGLAVDDERKGLDYFLLVDRWELGFGDVALFRCGASSCVTVRVSPLRFTYASGATFTIHIADLGETKRFRFSVETSAGIRFDPVARTYDFTDARYDFAPGLDRFSGQFWAYRLAPARLLVKSFTTTPARPRAGKPFTVRLQAARSDTGAVLARGRVTCTAHIAGKPLRPTSRRFVGTQAVCGFRVPVEARGKRLRGSIAVTSAGLKVVRIFARTIA